MGAMSPHSVIAIVARHCRTGSQLFFDRWKTTAVIIRPVNGFRRKKL